MPITFTCTCGKTLRVPDEHAGRRAKCPACNAVVNVPKPEPEPVFEVVEEPPPAVGTALGSPSAAKPVEDDDSYDGTTYSIAPESRDDNDGGDAPRGKPRLPNFRKGGDHYT